MRRAHLAAVLLGVACTLAGVAAQAAPPQINVFQFRGNTGIAEFRSFDDETCIETIVSVFVSESVRKEHEIGTPPNRQYDPLLAVTIAQTNTCTGLLVSFGSELVGDFKFNVQGNLGRATLRAMVSFLDTANERRFDLAIDLTWVAQGPLTREISVTRSNEDGIKSFSVLRSLTRAAVATGTVTGLGVNFTPEPSVDGLLTRARTGELVIVK